jgi:hypothetical protein
MLFNPLQESDSSMSPVAEIEIHNYKDCATVYYSLGSV